MNHCPFFAPMMKIIRFDLFCLLLYAHSLIASKEGTDSVPPVPSTCFSFPGHYCPNPADPCLCKSISLNTSRVGGPLTMNDLENPAGVVVGVLCCHLNTDQLRSGIECATYKSNPSAVVLHVRNSTLNVNSLTRSIISLTVTHSTILDIKTPLSDIVPNLSCLNLSSNGMGDLPKETLRGLSGLQALDLSMNNITQLPILPPRTDAQKMLWIDISGNERLGCDGIKEVMMSWNIPPMQPIGATKLPNISVPYSPEDSFKFPVHFHNTEDTFCIKSQNVWFDWKERIPLDKIVHILKLECPSGDGYTCSCVINRFEKSDFSVAVDCSGKGLTKLPDGLPSRTTILNVTNNKISNLDHLGRNKLYNDVREFYAENNSIISIEALEGSEFLMKFQKLGLKRNKMKELPMYFLRSIFDSNTTILRSLTLGYNEYSCDCHTYHELRSWILQNKKHIIDNEDMYCEFESPPVKIINLQREKVCLRETDWMDYLPLVVLAEVLLLVGLITKVSYDYWVFKTKGYLPWPASQTPKLPCCDWAFDA